MNFETNLEKAEAAVKQVEATLNDAKKPEPEVDQ